MAKNIDSRNKDNSKVNYLRLRKIFERRGDQSAIDKLVLSYLQEMTLDRLEKLSECRDPFLDGITLSKHFIHKRSFYSVIPLVMGGAQPEDIIWKQLEKTIDEDRNYNFAYYDILFRKGYIDAGAFQDIFKNNCNASCSGPQGLPKHISNIFDLLEKKDLKPYEELDFAEITSTITSHISLRIMENQCDKKTILKAMIRIIASISHTPSHYYIARYICEAISKGELDSETLAQYINVLMDMFSGLDETKIVDMLYERSDLLYLVLNECIARSILMRYVDQNKLDDLVYEGKIGPIMLVLGTFPKIGRSRFRILNSWAKNEVITALDVYCEAFSQDSIFTLTKDNDIYDRTLDKLHIDARKIAEKNMRIEPVNPPQE